MGMISAFASLSTLQEAIEKIKKRPVYHPEAASCIPILRSEKVPDQCNNCCNRKLFWISVRLFLL